MQNVSSIPVTVYLTENPAKSVKVTLTPDFSSHTDETNNPDKTISLSDDYLLFAPWDDYGHTFNLTVAFYDTTVGDEFDIVFDFDGDNAASYIGGTSVTFQVITMSDVLNPSITLVETVTTGQWSMSGISVTLSGAGRICFLTVPRDIAPPSSSQIIFEWDSNEDGTREEIAQNAT